MRDNLIDDLSLAGAANLLDALLEKRLFAIRITEIDAYLKAIADHKATL